jgi:hypothetical protein
MILYKTVVNNILEEYPELYHRLRLGRKLLAEVDRYAAELREDYLELRKRLSEEAATEVALSTIEERIARVAEAVS